MKRRRLLQAGAVAGSAALLAGCDGAPAWNLLARRLEDRPERPSVPGGAAADPDVRLLQRATFGPRPGDLDELRALGRAGWIDRQLSPSSIDDRAAELRVRRFESLHHTAGDAMEFKKRVVEEELSRATLLRAVHSRRQLHEVLVHFWTDHFNIALAKGDCAWFKAADDRDVIRRHALGNFRDLLRASALSPAMLVYLDGKANRKAEGRVGPNENYARELLELHALGVHGGYTQRDVMEAARCLTGWGVREKWNRGAVVFRPGLHDDGPKTVLGRTIPAGGGERDLDALLDIVVTHPATATHLATKLCRRLVADDPPAGLVGRAAAAFRAGGWEIRPLVREILAAPELAAAPSRLKRPFHFVVSALRALDADTDGGTALLQVLRRLGQAPFHHPTPDGYPDEAAPWLGTLLWRWNFALDLAANRLKGTSVPHEDLARRLGAGLPAHLLGRVPTELERKFVDGAAPELAVAVLLASPGFQRF